MQDQFNTQSRKCILQTGTNQVLNLATLPLFELTPDDDGSAGVNFGGGGEMTFDVGEVARVKQGIEEYNAAGGRYFWLIPEEVAINMDVVTSVAAVDGSIWVDYPGGRWESDDIEDAQGVYERYLKEGLQIQPGTSEVLERPFQAAPKNKGLSL